MTQKAYLALGCFWGPDEFFSKLKGVKKTLVGYSGGKKVDPTYHDLGDHSETIEIEFNPDEITYEEILEHFFKQHDPRSLKTTQYRSAIFFLDDQQKKAAEEAKKKMEESLGQIKTAIEPFGKFYPAEEYHQKYLDKSGSCGSHCSH
jgi:methionine-S-sulfoxide reductase